MIPLSVEFCCLRCFTVLVANAYVEEILFVQFLVAYIFSDVVSFYKVKVLCIYAYTAKLRCVGKCVPHL